MNSKCASVSYVASTQSVFQTLITKLPIPDRGSTPSVAGDLPEPPSTSNTIAPPPTAATPTDPHPEPATAAHHRSDGRDDWTSHTGTLRDHHRREHHRESYTLLGIIDSHERRRAQSSSHREGHPRDHHREGSSGYYSSNRDSNRSYCGDRNSENLHFGARITPYCLFWSNNDSPARHCCRASPLPVKLNYNASRL